METSQGRGSSNMGSHKHGISGVAPKSPRLRLWVKLMAERGTASQCLIKSDMFDSVQEAFESNRKKHQGRKS